MKLTKDKIKQLTKHGFIVVKDTDGYTCFQKLFSYENPISGTMEHDDFIEITLDKFDNSVTTELFCKNENDLWDTIEL